MSLSVFCLQHGHSLYTILNCSRSLSCHEILILGGGGGIFMSEHIVSEADKKLLPLHHLFDLLDGLCCEPFVDGLRR